MAEEWTINDVTRAKTGYLTLRFQGKRVCDFFPFAPDTEEHVVRQQAELICRTMNETEELRRLAADGTRFNNEP